MMFQLRDCGLCFFFFVLIASHMDFIYVDFRPVPQIWVSACNCDSGLGYFFCSVKCSTHVKILKGSQVWLGLSIFFFLSFFAQHFQTHTASFQVLGLLNEREQS